MDVAFVETGIKTGVSVDSVKPTSQRLFVQGPIAAIVGTRAASDPEGEERGHIVSHRLRNSDAPGDQRDKRPTLRARLTHALNRRCFYGALSGEATGNLPILALVSS